MCWREVFTQMHLVLFCEVNPRALTVSNKRMNYLWGFAGCSQSVPGAYLGGLIFVRTDYASIIIAHELH